MELDVLQKHPRIILYDGVCKLCNGWSQFVVKHDIHNEFRLASVQSEVGKKILRAFDMPTNMFDTMLYVENGTAYKQIDAFLKVIKHFNHPWRWLGIFRLIPKAIRDWLYDRIALNRYTLFGKYDQCMLPSDEYKNKFLDDE